MGEALKACTQLQILSLTGKLVHATDRRECWLAGGCCASQCIAASDGTACSYLCVVALLAAYSELYIHSLCCSRKFICDAVARLTCFVCHDVCGCVPHCVGGAQRTKLAMQGARLWARH